MSLDVCLNILYSKNTCILKYHTGIRDRLIIDHQINNWLDSMSFVYYYFLDSIGTLCFSVRLCCYFWNISKKTYSLPPSLLTTRLETAVVLWFSAASICVRQLLFIYVLLSITSVTCYLACAYLLAVFGRWWFNFLNFVSGFSVTFDNFYSFLFITFPLFPFTLKSKRIQWLYLLCKRVVFLYLLCQIYPVLSCVYYVPHTG